ncbi:MAG: oligosaccharide flippase family protein [Patescibacteria group bacterium]
MATKKVYWNTIAQIGGKISTALISIFLIKILTNYLDLAGYGLYSKIYNYLSIFSVIADLGLYTVTVREISAHKDDPEKVRNIAGNILTLRTGMGLAIIALSLGMGLVLPGYDSKVALTGILIAGIFTLFGLMNSSIMSMLQAYLKTEFSFFSTTVGKIVNLLGVMAVVFVLLPKPFPVGGSFPYEDLAFTLVMIAGLLGNIVMTAMVYFYSLKVERVGFRFDPVFMKSILKSSLPYGLALFLNVVYFKVDVILLSILEPAETADRVIALYGVPMKIVEVGMMFGTVFLNSMLPLFTAEIASPKTLLPLIRKAYKLLLFFGTGIAVFIASKPAEILTFIANKSYLEPIAGYTSADALVIVSYIFLFYFISSLFTYLLVASSHQSRLLKINAIVTVVNLVGNLIIIPYYSFVGSAIVTLACQILLFAQTAYATRDIVKFDFSPKTTGAVVLGVVAAFAMMKLTDSVITRTTEHFLGNGFVANFAELSVAAVLFTLIYAGIVFGLDRTMAKLKMSP